MVIAQVAHWGLALIPVLLLLAVYVWLDAFKLMSFREIVLLLLLGGLAALIVYPISGRVLDALPLGFSTYSRFVAPWIEEAIKAVVIIGLFWFNRIGYKLDAVISGFAIGAGFSVVENIIYLWVYPDYGAGTWMVRGLGTAVMHGTTLAERCCDRARTRRARNAGGGRRLPFQSPVVRTRLSDRGRACTSPSTSFPIVRSSRCWDRWSLHRSRSWRSSASGPPRPKNGSPLKALSTRLSSRRSGQGHWPEGPSGKKIAALAQRVDSETAKRLRRYWELQVGSSTKPKKRCWRKRTATQSSTRRKIQAAFAELKGLRKALGRSTFTALKALLPFSRNDYWEVSELRQRLSRDR